MPESVLLRRLLQVIALAGVGLGFGGQPAEAVPSFAGQTGQPCSTCHVGGFGPQLTPFGRAFKIEGYTQQGGDGWQAKNPLSVMMLSSFSATRKDLPQGQQTRHFGVNNNVAIDQISVFLAGRVSDHSGGFAQFTYSPIDGSVVLDQVDLRPYVTTVSLGGKDLVLGMTVNNSPTVQDTYTSTPAWGFPYVASALAPSPAAGPVLSGAFAQNTIGYTAYAWYDRSLYVEGGVYQTMTPWLMARVGSGYGPGAASGVMPYLRAAYEWNWNGQSAHIGAIFLQSNVNPAVANRMADGSNGHDQYTDFAVDGSYMWLGDGTNTVTLQGIYTHESQHLAGSAAAANLASGTSYGNNYQLNQSRVEVSYWYKNTYGATLGWQSTWGNANPVLYQPGPVGGSNNGKPNSNAFMAELDWVPFGKMDSWAQPLANLKLGAQFTAYTKFNGAGRNYDGSGRSAAANDTIFLFAWLMF
jgi:hypothetical protein